MEQFVKQRLPNSRQVGQVVPEQVNHLPMYCSSHPSILWHARQEPDRAIPDPNRWLLRKLADAVFNFLGYQRIVKPFRNKQWD